MFTISPFYFIVACSLGSIVAAQNDESCDACDYLGVLFYEDIGCKAVGGSEESCPNRYSCPRIRNDGNTCYHSGKIYKNGENIDVKDAACSNCTCKSGYKQGHIICNYYECPPTPTPKEGCYYRSKAFDCCPTEEYCPNEATDNVVTCEYNGAVYNDGDWFTPTNSCQQCRCSEGFKGELEEPYCQPPDCLTDVYYQREVKKKCAPLYSVQANLEKQPLCCPYKFICEEDVIESTFIEKGPKGRGSKCAFNGGFYNTGDSLNVNYTKSNYEEMATCNCTLPPIMTCFYNYRRYPYPIIDPINIGVEEKRSRNSPYVKVDRAGSKEEQERFKYLRDQKGHLNRNH